ncbi:DNA methyltransferase [Bacillus mangrovi]|uniref:DNA methyltransferase n=1 Tax=Metabacillus mangrovi TaxID=1491830 RepID=A0A7X2S7B9_9BACI|nr:MGMT family protein [Metabacillus mangrovi]MTH54815.1 DNA methyltransferase [Metabacillus mangrovi]
MESFTVKAISIIKSIPEGRVMSYGQIAAAAGAPRGARQVARILHSMSGKYDLPWHRVVSRNGELSIKDQSALEWQLKLLADEGIEIEEGPCIAIEKYRYSF